MPRLQELLLHALSYCPVDGSHPAVNPEAAAARQAPAAAAHSGSCLAQLSAACPALRRLDIRGMLAVELGGLAALTQLEQLSQVEVDMQWYSVLDEAAAAALQALKKRAVAAAMGVGAAAGRGEAVGEAAVGAAAGMQSQQG